MLAATAPSTAISTGSCHDSGRVRMSWSRATDSAQTSASTTEPTTTNGYLVMGLSWSAATRVAASAMGYITTAGWAPSAEAPAVLMTAHTTRPATSASRAIMVSRSTPVTAWGARPVASAASKTKPLSMFSMARPSGRKLPRSRNPSTVSKEWLSAASGSEPKRRAARYSRRRSSPSSEYPNRGVVTIRAGATASRHR